LLAKITTGLKWITVTNALAYQNARLPPQKALQYRPQNNDSLLRKEIVLLKKILSIKNIQAQFKQQVR